MAAESKSPWVWVGCGCAAIVGVGLVLIAAATLFGIRTARTMADPVARQDKALTILSADAIPSEYETDVAIKIPFFAEIVVLEAPQRQFVYLKGLRTKADLKAAFADDDSFDKELRRAGLKVKRRQKILARDSIHVGSAEVRYILVDGDVNFDPGGSKFDFDPQDITEEGKSASGISAVFLMRCSAEDEPRLGLWMGSSARVQAEAGSAVDAQDTTPDRAALVAFIEQFGFCTG